MEYQLSTCTLQPLEGGVYFRRLPLGAFYVVADNVKMIWELSKISKENLKQTEKHFKQVIEKQIEINRQLDYLFRQTFEMALVVDLSDIPPIVKYDCKFFTVYKKHTYENWYNSLTIEKKTEIIKAIFDHNYQIKEQKENKNYTYYRKRNHYVKLIAQLAYGFGWTKEYIENNVYFDEAMEYVACLTEIKAMDTKNKIAAYTVGSGYAKIDDITEIYTKMANAPEVRRSWGDLKRKQGL